MITVLSAGYAGYYGYLTETTKDPAALGFLGTAVIAALAAFFFLVCAIIFLCLTIVRRAGNVHRDPVEPAQPESPAQIEDGA